MNLKIMHFTAKWCPFCPSSERAFEQFRDKHPKIQAELVDIDSQPDVAARFRVDAVPTSLIAGGPRTHREACYTIDDFEAFWRSATEKPERTSPAKKQKQKQKKAAPKAAKKKPAGQRPAKKGSKQGAKKAKKKGR